MTADDLVTRPADLAGAVERAREGGTLRQLWWRFCLKPYGDALCTPGAAFWIFCARVAIFVMAAAEAISWSYLGYYIGQSSQPWVTAALAGLAIFSVIWIVDASFITLDTSRRADEAAILGQATGGRADKLKLAAGLLIRAAIISATLVISAPFLAQLVFFRDISAEMGRRDAALVAQGRAQLEGAYDARIADLRTMRRALDVASIEEAAGSGPSRRLGRGPVVATIERRLAEVDRDLAALHAEKQAALGAYDSLGRRELQQRFGLKFSEDGIRTRGEILASLRANETYANAELAIRGFLAFLFLALIVLKLFQPASVSVYFSEILQDLNAQYRAGSFDSWLPPEERSYARVGLTPLRFRTWCVENYRGIRSEEETQRRLARTMSMRAAREAELRTLRRNAEAESEPLRREIAAAEEALSLTRDGISRVQGALQASREALAARVRALESVSVTLRSGIGGDAFVRGAEAQAAVEREAAALRTTIREQEAELERLTRQESAQEAAVAGLRTQLASRLELVRSIDAGLARITTESSSALAGG